MATQKAHSVPTFRQVFVEPATYPLALVALMWMVHLSAQEFGWSLSFLGVKPRDWSTLTGIVTMPFIHGGYEHLMNNSLPIIVLGWALFKFYRDIAWKALLGIAVIGGFWLWISGREAYHIGASGLVYGLAAFLFLSGWLRREKRVAALSLVIVFVYGSLWWGILPVDPQMSWEGHLWGALAGFGMAWYLRKKGPQRPLYQWEKDEIEEQKRQAQIEAIAHELIFEVIEGDVSNQADNEADSAKSAQQAPSPIRYTFKPRSKSDDKE